MAVGSFAAANVAIFGIFGFPQFYSKKGEKEMLQICPSLFIRFW